MQRQELRSHIPPWPKNQNRKQKQYWNKFNSDFKTNDLYVYLWLIHVHIWQKSIQYCKAIILQLKILKLRKSVKFSILFISLYFHHEAFFDMLVMSFCFYEKTKEFAKLIY